MQWRSRLASALVVFGLAAVGCDTDKPFVPAGAVDPELLRTIEAKGRSDENMTRAQAPDAERPILLAQAPAGANEPISTQTVGYTAARVIAVVNGEAILEEEVRAAGRELIRRLEYLPEPERSKRQLEVTQQVLDALIDREVVLQDAFERMDKGPGGKQNLDKLKEYAEKDFQKNWLTPVKNQFKLKTDEELKALLAKEGMSFEMQRRLHERQFMMDTYLRQSVIHIVDQIGHVQLVEYYDSQPEAFKVEDEVEWQDLCIAASRYATREAAKRFAESLAQRVRQGEDFVKLAEQFDDGDGKLRKSQGLGHKRGEIKPPEFEAPLFKLTEGEVMVLEQPSSFHVLRVVKRQNAGILPFDEKTQKKIKEQLANEIMQRETKRLIAELRRKAVVEIYK